MVRFTLFITILALTSCGEGKLGRYGSIVQEADRFEIFYQATNKTVSVPLRLTANLKKILTRNIKPEPPRKITNYAQIDVYKSDKRIAFFMIGRYGANPFVTFHSNRVNFGFPLTYGIGQTIDNFYTDHTR